MSDPKSQFMLGAYKEGNFLLDSLAVAFEDTRTGLSPAAATRLTAMAGYLTANVVKERTENVVKATTGEADAISTAERTRAENFNAYVIKIGAGTFVETEAKPVTALRTKPGNGMM